MHKLSSCFWAESNSVSIKRTCGCRGCAVGSPPKHFGPGELLGPTDHLSRPVSVFFSPPYFPSLPCPFFISLGNKRKPSQCEWDTWWEEFLFEEVPLKSTGSVKKKNNRRKLEGCSYSRVEFLCPCSCTTFCFKTMILTESMTPCNASKPPFTGKTWSLLSAIFANCEKEGIGNIS